MGKETMGVGVEEGKGEKGKEVEEEEVVAVTTALSGLSWKKKRMQ